MSDFLKQIEALCDEAWQELVEKNDRTSPSDYPDMALITREELINFICDGIQLCQERTKAQIMKVKERHQ